MERGRPSVGFSLLSVAKRVYLLVRGPGLAETMSRYLISRIEACAEITQKTWTQIQALEGGGYPAHHRSNSQTGVKESEGIQHLFIMTGADPNTSWLGECLALDGKQFIKTGTELGTEWPLPRPPYLLETSLPEFSPVGDIRAGSLKRVAAAVGEGSMAVQFVHKNSRASAEPRCSADTFYFGKNYHFRQLFGKDGRYLALRKQCAPI